MGCDIHAHVEIRYQGKWEHYAMPSIKRWYELFGKMAGVRGEETPIVQPKGVPSDMSIVTRLDYDRWGVDAHTASWFDETELDNLKKWLNSEREKSIASGEKTGFMLFDLEYGVLNGTYLFGNGLTAFKNYDDCKYVPDGVDAVRLVFWFDN